MVWALSNEPLLWTTGWVLFNSLWLVTLVWIIHRLIQFLLRRTSAQTRYRAACTMLAVMIASLVLLGWIVWTRKPITDWVASPRALIDEQGHWTLSEVGQIGWLGQWVLLLTPVAIVIVLAWAAALVLSMMWVFIAWRRKRSASVGAALHGRSDDAD